MKRNVILAAIAVCTLAALTSAQTRIRFARGRTSTSVSGVVNGNTQRRFVLGARRGQTLSANISSANGCVKFDGPSTSTTFTTEAGDNWITITNTCRRRSSFVMTVSISY